MTYFEIVNPSDAYTISGEDVEAAILACVYLGNGKYALRDEKDEQQCPLFLFGGTDDYFQHRFKMTLEQFMKSISLDRLATALESVTIGSIASNRELDELLSHITDEVEREKFLAKRHDKRRSSLNDIGARSKEIAKAIRKKIKEESVPQ